MHRLSTALLCGLLVLAAGLVLPPRASAHAELVDAVPTPNGTVVDAPAAIELRFSEPIDAELAYIDLLDARQDAVAGLGAIEVAEDGSSVRVALPELEVGTYTVAYQVISTVDGHATAGAFAFVIDPTGSEAPPTTPPDARTPAVDGWAVAARWVGLIGALVALGTVVMWWRSRRLIHPDRDEPPWLLVAGAAALSYAGLAAYLWLSARPIVAAVPERAGGFPLDFAAPFGATPFAMAMRVALAASLLTVLVAGAGSLLRSAASHPATGAAAVTTALAALALAGMSFAAHAAALGGIAFAIVDWGHLLAVAAWLGGLPAVVVLSRRVPGNVRTTARAILRRHGRLALVAAPLVALTGIANSPLVLGPTRGLVGSEYGNLLVAKALLLSVAVAIGAVNHLALRGHGRTRVAALVAAELVVAAVAVGAAATMVTIQPAAARQPALVSAPVAPAHLFGEAGPTDVHATIDLPTPGSQRYLVTVTDRDTGVPRDDVQLVFLELHPPADSDLPAERVELEPHADRPGLYTAQGAHLSVEGVWTVDVVVRRSGALDERAAFEVPVQQPSPPQLVPPADTGVGVPAPLALLWTFLPDGPLSWAPAAGALALLVASGSAWARRRSGRGTIGIVRIGLGALVVVTALGAGSRALVVGANEPTAEELADHVPDPAFAASTATGEAVYLANCAGCHGVEGDGRGPVRTLPAAGPLGEAVARMSSAELSYRIANGLAGTPMPAFAATLTEAERWHLVTYLEERWQAR